MKHFSLLRPHIQLLSRRASAPISSVGSDQDRRRIQMLVILVGFQFLLICMAGIQLLQLGQISPPLTLRFVVAGAMLVLIYMGHPTPAIGLMLIGLVVSNVVGLLTAQLWHVLYAIPTFVAVGVLLKWRRRIAYAVLMSVVLLIVVSLPQTPNATLSRDDVVVFVILSLISIVISTSVVDGDRSQIEHQMEVLQEREARYRLLAENISDMVTLHMPDGRFVYVSPSYTRAIGYTEQELMALTAEQLPSLIHAEDYEQMQKNAHKRILQGQTLTLQEYRRRRKDGSYFWVESYSTPIYDETGAIIRILSSSRDIDERKQAQAQNAHNETRYHTLFEQANAAVFIVDLPTYRMQANQRAAEMLGYSMQELVTLSYQDLIVPDGQDETRKQRLLSGNGLPPYECLFRRKDGSPLTTEISVELVRGEDGVPLYIQSVARDATERKRMELANQAFLEDIKALQNLQLELSEIDELESLYYHIVQLCQHRLGLERITLFRLDETQQRLHGIYHIDHTGTIHEARTLEDPITPEHWSHSVLEARGRVVMWLEGDIYREGTLVGGGWKVATALWNGRRAIGYLVCDNQISGRVPRLYETELISIIGNTLGHLIERKEMERILARSKGQLAEAEHIAHLGSWRWDAVTGVITWSDEIHRIFGIPQDIFSGKYEDFFATIHPLDREIVDKATRKAYELRIAYSVTHRINHPQWGERIVHSMGRTVTNSEGHVLYLIGTAQDVTDIKQVEHSLTIRNRYLNTLHDITLRLLNRHNIDELLNLLVKEAAVILDAPYAEIMLKDGDDLVVKAFTENQPFLAGDRISRGDGLLSWQAFDTLQPAVLNNYMDWPHRRDIYSQVMIHAVADFPITIGQACIGVLALARATENASFTSEEIHIGGMLSQLAALIMDNAHQHDDALQEIEERRRTEERLHALTEALEVKNRIEHEQRLFAETLHNTASIISSTLDLDEILKLILENIQRIIPHDSANIMLVENRVVSVVQHNGVPTMWRVGMKLSVETTSYLRLMTQTQQGCIVHDITLLDDWVDNVAEAQFRSYLAAPICLGGSVMGFLNLVSATPHYFTDEHAQHLQAFVSHAAIALKNAQLYRRSHALAAFEERQRLARDLHDSVTQTLFAASVTANAIVKQWRADYASVGDDLQDLCNLTQGALAEMRTLLLELRPITLIESNLNDLLQQLAATVKGRARLKVYFEPQEISEIPHEVKIALFRIAQEAINNTIKHAHARTLTMTLGEYDRIVELCVEDDGQGFVLGGIPARHMGIEIMRERAEEAGLLLDIISQPGQGTSVKAVWNHKDQNHHV